MTAPTDLLKQTTLITCTVDRFADLKRCLASVQPTRPDLAELIVVNNGPHAARIEEIAGRHGARVVVEPRRGVARARNAGIRAACGAFIAFIDDDAIAAGNWLGNLIARFSDAAIDCVLGAVLPQDPTDRLQQEFHRLACSPPPLEPIMLGAAASAGRFPLRLAMHGLTMNVAFRRDAFERFGQFDERFGRGTAIRSGEDTDLFFNILRRGGRILIEPSAVVTHQWPNDVRSLRRSIFAAACGHTAILTKYFLSEPESRGEIRRYIAGRWRDKSSPDSQNSYRFKRPQVPFILGTLYGPVAFLLSGKA